MATTTRAKATAPATAPAPQTVAPETSAAENVSKTRKPRSSLPMDQADIGGFEEVKEANPFARGAREHLSDTHPIQKAFDASLAAFQETGTGKVLAVNTETPQIITKLLRVAAVKRDMGVRINAKTAGKVIFQAQARQTRKPKTK